ncbi:MAG TPA: alpha-amylase family glycosyl hydrolase, partial [Polyangia bacterium]|nr:alpha-amylase family glycosyl hydrolase [Polyangia bacterium]
MPARIPTATYRLQLSREFSLAQAAELVEYLEALGVSDAYLSPVLTARAGSAHGYDVVNHEQVSPELGGEEALRGLLDRLRERGMGAILDVVPNHMCITGGGNRWWNDVLENGPSSPYARYFDIDWHPPKEDLVAKVLLPILGDQYGRVLENQEIQIRYEAGAFFACYYEHRFPLAPRSLMHILGPVVPELRATLGPTDEAVQELESILTAVRHLPRRTETEREQVEERQREKGIIKRRLAALMEAHAGVRQAIERSLVDLNGRRGEPHSFDRLEALLADQAFRLSFWRVASDEINYRRFFDINELAAIRVEEAEAFAAVHEVLFRLIEHGGVTGARIDHLDGLRDPVRYLEALQRRCHAALLQTRARTSASPAGGPAAAEESRCPCYLIVEKILVGDEPLREGWPVHGTTGYEFLQRVGGVLVERASGRRLRQIYEDFIGEVRRYRDVAYESKKLILRVAMSS